ncbi:MAG: methyltransferase domain-containing protein [Planctomycetota bacterium]
MGFRATLSELRERSLTPEIMDDPALEEREHLRALEGLERLNRFSLSARHVWSALAPIVAANPNQTLRVLDIATGAGDIPISLCKMAETRGVKLEIHACDISPRALEFARARASASKASVHFFSHNALLDSIPAGYDVITSSLFFHHLETAQAGDLLTQMGRSTRCGLVVNDLERSQVGWVLANVATRLLSSSPVVHVDGPLSVRAAFSLSEIGIMAKQAGLDNFKLQRRFPCRFVLSWFKNN